MPGFAQSVGSNQICKDMLKGMELRVLSSFKNGLPVVAMKLEFGDEMVELIREHGEFPNRYYSYFDGTRDSQENLAEHYELSTSPLTITVNHPLEACSDPNSRGIILGTSDSFVDEAVAVFSALSLEEQELFATAFLNSEELYNGNQFVAYNAPKAQSKGGIASALASALQLFAPQAAHAQDFPEWDPLSSLENALENAVDSMINEAGERFAEGDLVGGAREIVLEGAVGAAESLVTDAGDFCVDVFVATGAAVTDACGNAIDAAGDAVGDMCDAFQETYENACDIDWWKGVFQMDTP